MRIHDISIDLAHPEKRIEVRVKRDDSNIHLFRFTVLDKGTRFDAESFFIGIKAVKPDGKKIFNSCQLEKGLVTYVLSQALTQTVGEVNCELIFFKAGNVYISSPTFFITVTEYGFDENLVVSEEDLSGFRDYMMFSQEFALKSEAHANTARDKAAEAWSSASDAESYASSAEERADAASDYAEVASASAEKAKKSETNAASSASTASSKAVEASASAEKAKKSETNAASSASTAFSKATEASALAKDARKYSESWRGYVVTQEEYNALAASGQVKENQPYYVIDADNELAEATETTPGIVVVDSALSDTSKNPVQNKIVANALNEEISRAKAQEALKAPLASPSLTGTPTAPTAAANTNNEQVATTAFVKTVVNALVNGAPETLDTLKEIADAIAQNETVMDALNTAIGAKVDKVPGKGLSSNDYTSGEKNKLAGIASNANNYSLPIASSSVCGGVKTGYTANGKNYPVQLSNGQMFVNVPWTDTNTQEVTGVKGSSETSYRKGNVDITPANIGVLPSKLITQSQYDALSHAEQMNGTVYFIMD